MSRLTLSLLCLLALLALAVPLLVRAENRETDAPADPAAQAACELATNCSSCLASLTCGWCGNSDDVGTCKYCTVQNCGCSSSYTNLICPDAAKDVAMSILAIVAIVVGSAVGFCCLLALLTAIVFCLCCRRPGHQGYVINADQHHVIHHYHPEGGKQPYIPV